MEPIFLLGILWIAFIPVFIIFLLWGRQKYPHFKNKDKYSQVPGIIGYSIVWPAFFISGLAFELPMAIMRKGWSKWKRSDR